MRVGKSELRVPGVQRASPPRSSRIVDQPGPSPGPRLGARVVTACINYQGVRVVRPESVHTCYEAAAAPQCCLAACVPVPGSPGSVCH
jgi:hypothetical protein